MKKKVFFVISSLKAGGSERVFWLLSQGFDKTSFDVSVVLLNSNQKCYSNKIQGVRFIDLNAKKASLAFLKLRNLIKTERPFAVFSTTDHINILVAFVSFFVKIPNLIARASNIPEQMRQYDSSKARFWNLFTGFCYKRYNRVVCQSDEMKKGIRSKYDISVSKLAVIPNPVLGTSFFKENADAAERKKLIIVARLSGEKGIFRLLEIMAQLPENYSLTIVGDGVLKDDILIKIHELALQSRVTLAGQSNNVASLITQHDLFVLSSFTEGFPNVVLEALSVGVPVVTFRVGGVTGLIQNGFNGYIIEQGDLKDFKTKIIAAGNRSWNHEAIKRDVLEKYALKKIAGVYESLLV